MWEVNMRHEISVENPRIVNEHIGCGSTTCRNGNASLHQPRDEEITIR